MALNLQNSRLRKGQIIDNLKKKYSSLGTGITKKIKAVSGATNNQGIKKYMRDEFSNKSLLQITKMLKKDLDYNPAERKKIIEAIYNKQKKEGLSPEQIKRNLRLARKLAGSSVSDRGSRVKGNKLKKGERVVKPFSHGEATDIGAADIKTDLDVGFAGGTPDVSTNATVNTGDDNIVNTPKDASGLTRKTGSPIGPGMSTGSSGGTGRPLGL